MPNTNRSEKYTDCYTYARNHLYNSGIIFLTPSNNATYPLSASPSDKLQQRQEIGDTKIRTTR